jgi:hypothetical protein
MSRMTSRVRRLRDPDYVGGKWIDWTYRIVCAVAVVALLLLASQGKALRPGNVRPPPESDITRVR